VIACDLTPELMEVGKNWAAEVGVQLFWEIADTEALPYGDGEFDAVLSCLDVMFAPHHRLPQTNFYASAVRTARSA
jgi:ubiquinone/menaquinone biosynthesis C-methylase UbiE